MMQSVARTGCRFLRYPLYFVIATCISIKIDHLPLGKVVISNLFYCLLGHNIVSVLIETAYSNRKTETLNIRTEKNKSCLKWQNKLLIKFTIKSKWSFLIRNKLQWQNKADSRNLYNPPEQHLFKQLKWKFFLFRNCLL